MRVLAMSCCWCCLVFGTKREARTPHMIIRGDAMEEGAYLSYARDYVALAIQAWRWRPMQRLITSCCLFLHCSLSLCKLFYSVQKPSHVCVCVRAVTTHTHVAPFRHTVCVSVTSHVVRTCVIEFACVSVYHNIRLFTLPRTKTTTAREMY